VVFILYIKFKSFTNPKYYNHFKNAIKIIASKVPSKNDEGIHTIIILITKFYWKVVLCRDDSTRLEDSSMVLYLEYEKTTHTGEAMLTISYCSMKTDYIII
jgi:hypothetical protein